MGCASKEDMTAQRLMLCCIVLCGLVVSTAGAALVGAQPGDTTGSITVNGYVRNFVYSVSTVPSPSAGRPLVILLHGDGGDMGLPAGWKQAVLQDSVGAVLLSAQGRNQIPPAAAIDGSAWRFRMDEAGRAYDDVDFINQLISQATASAALLGTAINPQQVYVVGESRGAGFAYVLYADPRTRNKIRAIVPISGTFYCEGDAVNTGTPGTPPSPGSDTTCGEVSEYGYWGPKASLFTAPGVTRAPHILDVHGQLPPDGTELPETAPPALDRDYESSQWAGWGDAAGCYTVQVSSQTEHTLPQPIGGWTVKSYAYSQAEEDLAARCAGLDLTFYIAQGGGHVPSGFEQAAWCFLSGVGGTASTTACQLAGTPTSTPLATRVPTPTLTHTPPPTSTTGVATPTNTTGVATPTSTTGVATPTSSPTTTSNPQHQVFLPVLRR